MQNTCLCVNPNLMLECSISGDVCEEDSVRLVGGHTMREGRVQLCRNGQWHSICADNWNQATLPAEANVVCSQLGYPGDSGKLLYCSSNT